MYDLALLCDVYLFNLTSRYWKILAVVVGSPAGAQELMVGNYLGHFQMAVDIMCIKKKSLCTKPD